jgi:hypothetical protein
MVLIPNNHINLLAWTSETLRATWHLTRNVDAVDNPKMVNNNKTK